MKTTDGDEINTPEAQQLLLDFLCYLDKTDLLPITGEEADLILDDYWKTYQ